MSRIKKKLPPPEVPTTTTTETAHYTANRGIRKAVRIIPRNLHQEEYLSYLCDDSKMIVLAHGPAGCGKAQPLDAKIKIPGGWITMGETHVGQKISTPNGKEANITAIFPQGEKDVFEITFKDGRKTECCGEHLWKVYYADNWSTFHIMSTFEIMSFMTQHRKPLRIPLIEPEDSSEINLPIDPYVLGALLGDGNFSQKSIINFSSAEEEIILKLNNLLEGDGSFIKSSGKYDYRFINENKSHVTQKDKFVSNLKTQLFDFRLFGTKSNSKFIPPIYFNSSTSQKIKLLQGLFDTDGTVDRIGNSLSYTTVSKQLCDDVVYLIRSIGGYAKVSSRIPSYTYKGIKKYGQLAFTIKVQYTEKKKLVSLTRKKNLLTNNDQYDTGKISIKSITWVGKKVCQCILIDSVDHLYITDNFIVTHNTFMAMLAGIKALSEKKVHKLILCRPAIGVEDEDHGFLPGDLNEKMEPWVRPLFDVLYEYYSAKEIAMMVENKVIEVIPLMYMRGRNIKDAYVIVDEAQNSTIGQCKMLFTRLCDNSKIIVTGDNAQSDKKATENGLLTFKNLLVAYGKSNYISSVEFAHKDIERHPVVSEVLKIFGDF